MSESSEIGQLTEKEDVENGNADENDKVTAEQQDAQALKSPTPASTTQLEDESIAPVARSDSKSAMSPTPSERAQSQPTKSPVNERPPSHAAQSQRNSATHRSDRVLSSTPSDRHVFRPDTSSEIAERGLSNDEYLQRLNADNLELSRDIAEWRTAYGLRLDEREILRILRGQPSISDVGFSREESIIAEEVVRSQVNEMQSMPINELVNFINADLS